MADMQDNSSPTVGGNQADTPLELANMHEPVFGMCLTVLVGRPEDYHDWLNEVGFKGDRLTPDTRQAIWQDLRPENMVDGETDSEFIWLRSKSYACLAHELIHMTTRMFEDKGIPISHDNDEVLCYYIQYWIDRISQGWGSDVVATDNKANTSLANPPKDTQ